MRGGMHGHDQISGECSGTIIPTWFDGAQWGRRYSFVDGPSVRLTCLWGLNFIGYTTCFNMCVISDIVPRLCTCSAGLVSV
ncbi:hypothetical protein NITLEN_30333 [Nitrospira lenta]|uniref:Uncharacterized protein n=1 Tax=Nitrospira lenta TaxID=1436998 RepID=A0A330L6C5_9BACT|nr:hypothetical protein NITLEN_30333 [Nitrospira lenta]